MKYIIMIDLSKILKALNQSAAENTCELAMHFAQFVRVVLLTRKYKKHFDSIGKMDDDKQHVSLHTII